MQRLISLAVVRNLLRNNSRSHPVGMQPLVGHARLASRSLVCDSAPPSPPLPRLHMVFTCAKCDTRAVKSFTKNAYERGVVLVTCPGCQARHVIADNLGWFGEEKNVEEILKKKGQDVRIIKDTDIDYVP